LQRSEKSRRHWKRIALSLLVLAVILGSLLGVALVFLYQAHSVTDERLIGTWKSDAELSIADAKMGRALDETQEAAMRKIFGKLTVTYMAGTRRFEIDGWKMAEPYQVVGKDDKSVILRSSAQPLTGEELVQIHFVDNDTFWVSISATMGSKEFFRRVK
jgi:hypothetical protein